MDYEEYLMIKQYKESLAFKRPIFANLKKERLHDLSYDHLLNWVFYCTKSSYNQLPTPEEKELLREAMIKELEDFIELHDYHYEL